MGLLGHLLALRQNTTYAELLRDRITSPLKMTSTAITLTDEQKQRLAPPATTPMDATSPIGTLPTLAGAGAIRSSAADSARASPRRTSLRPPVNWARPSNWPGKSTRPPLEKGAFALGLLWHVARDGNTRWHNGQTGGYHAQLMVNRDLHIAVVVLSNTATMQVDSLAENVMQLVAGEQINPRPCWRNPLRFRWTVMRRYVGRYQLIVPGLVLTISLEEDKLLAAVTNQPSARLFPRSETEWAYRLVPASIEFKVDAEGRCDVLNLIQSGWHVPARRIK